MKKAYDIMKEQALDVCKGKEAFESVAKRHEHVHFASTIKLNVGGQYFYHKPSNTYKRPRINVTWNVFKKRFDTKPTKDGSYFIDLDGTHFRYILYYLRTRPSHSPKRQTSPKRITRRSRVLSDTSESCYYD